ncbi:MAG: DUF2066 domain-containing protein [Rudaea sp.]
MPLAAILCRLVLIVPLLVLAPWAHADGLYSAQVPVNSQSDADRAEALKSALGQVVVKLSGGDNAVLARPAVVQALANANNYVQQYQYTQDVVTTDAKPQVRLNLVAQFDRTAVDKLIANLGLAASAANTQVAQAATDTQAHAYRVWIGGVQSAQDYARAVGSLSRNELVRSVQAEQARSDGLELRLDITGPLQRLLDSLAGSPLRVVDAKPPVDGVDAVLAVVP